MASLEGADSCFGTSVEDLGIHKPQDTRQPSNDLMGAALGREDPHGPPPTQQTMQMPPPAQPQWSAPQIVQETATKPSGSKELQYILDNKDSIMVAVIFLILNSGTFRDMLSKNIPQLFVEGEMTPPGLVFLGVLAGVLFFLGKRFWR